LGFGWRSAFGAIALFGALYTAVAAVAVRRVPASIARAGARSADDSSPESLGGPDSVSERFRSAGARLLAYGRSVVESPIILLLTTLWFVNSVAAWGIRTYAATLLDSGYGLAAEPANLVASVMLVVGAVILLGGGYVADRTGPLPLLYVGYGSLVVLAAVLSSVVLPVVAAVGLVLLLAATIDLSRPARSTLTDLASERGDVGKNFALMTVGISAGGAVAPPVFGYLIETSGVGVAFVGVAATAAVALVLSILLARRLD
jgi:predicted MFS family arabinose efflux permease